MEERIRRQAVRYQLCTGQMPRVARVNPLDEVGATVDDIQVVRDEKVPVGNVWVSAE